MSDLRARIQGALEAARLTSHTFTAGDGYFSVAIHTESQAAAIAVDVLLSLPDIAVVELPARLPGFVEGERLKWEICQTFIKADRAGVHVNGLLMHVGEARAYAARLLAAANAAEQQGAVR